MNKLPFPIRTHSGLKVVITQPYGAKSMVSFYKEHNGVDAVLSGDNLQTYGTEIVTVMDGCVVKKPYWYDDAYSPNGNGFVLNTPVFEKDGIKMYLELRFAHFSAVAKGLEEGMVIQKAFTPIGYIGNSGLVDPKPDAKKPCKGAHLHFGVCVYHIIDDVPVLQNADNGLYGLVDPLEWFDPALAPVGADTGIEKDLPAFLWAIKQAGLKDPGEIIIFALKHWWNGK
jgi:murein DD-endopeptidase MepM/ murein hydrolase activator NlpD